MARLPRYVVPGQPQHVVQRGNNRIAIFAADDDFRAFCDFAVEAFERHQCAVHAYVLMTNHVHFLVTPQTEDAIWRSMQSVGRSYVRRFNDAYRRTGTLWEGRYHATLIDSERYLLACYRYIELNPVRSGLVRSPEEYRWSSYRTNGLGEDDPLITPHRTYISLGIGPESRQTAYRALFRVPVARPVLADIRNATQRGLPLGDEMFRQEMATRALRRPQILVRDSARR